MDMAATSSTRALAPTPAAPAPAAAPATAGGTAKNKLSAAAKQFEAIFVRQMLAEARKAKPAGEDTLFGGQGLETFTQMQDARFAEIASDRGAFGLARAIETQLSAVVGKDRK